MSALWRPLRLRLPNVQASVEAARLAVNAYLADIQSAGCPGETAALSNRAHYSVELALEEVLMNQAWHAYTAPGAGWVELEVELQADTVTLRFCDEGRPFDPSQPSPTPAAGPLEDAQVGGLGLSLLHKRARRIAYERRDGRNALTIDIGRQ
jgi:sigma-B regulation protein RsbU (phosphoserine phosphatase)